MGKEEYTGVVKKKKNVSRELRVEEKSMQETSLKWWNISQDAFSCKRQKLKLYLADSDIIGSIAVRSRRYK